MRPIPSPSPAEQQAAALAARVHAGQRYGEHPYVHHLATVRQVLADYNLHGDLAVAARLHDTLEDTTLTREAIAAEFGDRVAALVWAVTGVGPNRKARVADAHAKIVALGREAVLLKLADRIANVEASAPGSRHLTMYREEQPGFEAMIEAAALGDARTWHPVPAMLARLRAALG